MRLGRRDNEHRRSSRLRSIEPFEWVSTAAIVLLISAVLYQAPLFEVHLSAASSGVLVHSWDIVWLLIATIGVSICVKRRRYLVNYLRLRDVPWHDPIIFVAALALYASISLIWTYERFGQNGLSGSVIDCFRFASVAFLATLIRAVHSERLRRTVVWTFLVVSAIAGLWAFIAWRTETTVYHLGLRAIRVQVTRAGGPFGNWFASGTSDEWWAPSGASNVLGFWLAVAVPVALVQARSLWRITWIGMTGTLMLVGTLVAGLVATHSRESWLATVVACLVLLGPAARRQKRAYQLGAALGLTVAILVVVVAAPSVESRIERSFTTGTFDYQTGPQARITAWGLGVRWGEERFPLGWGVGAVEKHQTAFGGHTTAENVFLQYFADLGVVGVIALIAATLQGLRLGMQRFTRRLSVTNAALPPAFFAALIVHGMFGNTLGYPTVQVLWACALGLSVASRRTDKTGARDATDAALPVVAAT